jgi:hypothetical protein
MRSIFSGVNCCQKGGGEGNAERDVGAACSSAIFKTWVAVK